MVMSIDAKKLNGLRLENLESNILWNHKYLIKIFINYITTSSIYLGHIVLLQCLLMFYGISRKFYFSFFAKPKSFFFQTDFNEA